MEHAELFLMLVPVKMLVGSICVTFQLVSQKVNFLLFLDFTSSGVETVRLYRLKALAPAVHFIKLNASRPFLLRAYHLASKHPAQKPISTEEIG